jgi:two-component system nitrate/nitrite sensor histidine kinase NarX
MEDNHQIFTFKEMAELERRRLVAASLRGILAMLNADSPLEKLLNYIVNQACPLLNADAAAIYYLQDTGILTAQAFTGIPVEYIRYANIPLGKLATGQATLIKEPIFIQDTQELVKNQHLPQDLSQALQLMSQNYRSLLSVPIIIREESYGALTLYFLQTHNIPKEEITLAIDFANQAALAIDNTRLRLRIEKDAVTQERNRLARELHDSVTQRLFSASLIAETLPKIIERDPEKGQEALDELRLLTSGALAEMRSLLLELRPQAMENIRLEVLLKQLSEATSGRLRRPIALKITGQATMPVTICLTFYRIAQEALNNIMKHAEANDISIELNCVEDSINKVCKKATLTITDDGCGFKEGQNLPGHFGFGIMKERAQTIGALLTIQSHLKCGTKVQLVWEFTKEELL